MNAKIKLSLIALMMLVAIWRLVACGGQADVAPVAFKHYEALASMAAEFAAENLPDANGPVVVVLEETDSAPLASREKAFRKTASSLGVKDIKVIQVTAEEWSSEHGWNMSLLQRVTQDAPDPRGIISFVGTPPRELLRLNPSPEPFPYFLAVLPATAHLDAFMRADIVHEAIVPSTLADAPSVSPKSTHREWFEAYYQLHTPSRINRGAPNVISAPGSADEVQY